MTDTTSLALASPAPHVDWAAEISGAQMLLKSGLAPSSIKTPEAAMFVIMVGRDLGLSPTQALRSVQVIQGKVEIAADMQLALFKRAGGRAVWTTLTDTAAVLDLAHPNGDTHRESFTMEDARRAKLGGDNWTKYPKAMLRSRCITAGMKSVGFDVLAGVYAPGEVAGTESAPAEATVSVVAPAVIPSTPAAPEPEDAEIVDTETGEVVSAADRKAALANAYPLPFGKSKGSELGQMETDNLQSARDWASDKPRYALFVEYADIVLAGRKAEADAIQAESKRLSYEEAHPALAEANDDLPF